MSRKKIIWSIVILTIVFGAVYAYKEYTRTNKDLSRVKPDIHIESGKLIEAFEQNDSAANKTFLGKILEVTGSVKKIENPDTGNYFVVLGNPAVMSSVRCQMDSAHASDAANLYEGTSVTIRGACTGFEKNELLGETLGSDVHLNRCVLVSTKN